VVTAHFAEAYTFRACIEFIRHVCTQANFVFYPDRIELVRGDSDVTTLVEWSISTSELTQYKYNAYDDAGNKLDCFAAGFSLAEMVKGTKAIAKKDGMAFFIKPDDNVMNIQVISAGKQGSTGYVQLIEVPIIEYDKVVYQRDEKQANVRVPAANFAKMCSSMTSSKCQCVRFTSYPTGVECLGMLADNSLGRRENFGICSKGGDVIVTPEPVRSTNPETRVVAGTPTIRLVMRSYEDLNTINVKTTPVIKAMGRFNNIAGTGVVKVTNEPGKPMRLICNVGNYGMLAVYIRDSTAHRKAVNSEPAP